VIEKVTTDVARKRKQFAGTDWTFFRVDAREQVVKAAESAAIQLRPQGPDAGSQFGPG